MPSRRAALAVLAGYLLALLGNRSLRRVEGGSMRPTLVPGDLVVVVPPWLAGVRRGTVVVVPDPREPTRRTVKRVAARAGEAVDVAGTRHVAGAGQLVVLGDDLGASTDSRAFGPVAAVDVVAVAVAALRPWRRLWPPTAPRRRRPRAA